VVERSIRDDRSATIRSTDRKGIADGQP